MLIIGAGGTGRGFIPRLLKNQDVQISFLDSNKSLVEKLNYCGAYSIFVGEKSRNIRIDRYRAYDYDSSEILSIASEADYIFISVGEQNLPGLKHFFDKLIGVKKVEDISVVVAENGVSPRGAFIKAMGDTDVTGMQISQAIIFCSSLPLNKGELDIVSEDYGFMPYDSTVAKILIPFEKFVPTDNFASLMQRKIYTYNCLSACIAYLGYIKGYDNYADAANDCDIVELCERVRGELDEAIALRYKVSIYEQHAFSERALKKFKDRTIKDTVEKNARAVLRKLGAEERLIGPLSMLNGSGVGADVLLQVIASALVYLKCEETMEYDGIIYKDPCHLLRVMHTEKTLSNSNYEKIKDIYSKLFLVNVARRPR